ERRARARAARLQARVVELGSVGQRGRRLRLAALPRPFLRLKIRHPSSSRSVASSASPILKAWVLEPLIPRIRACQGEISQAAGDTYSNPRIDTLAVVISVGHRISVRPVATATFCVPLSA